MEEAPGVVFVVMRRGWNRAGCTREPGPEKPGRALFLKVPGPARGLPVLLKRAPGPARVAPGS